MMESWFLTVKSEEGERFERYAHAGALFDYIEVFYKQPRRHSTLGQISPAEFERRAGDAALLISPPDRITLSPPPSIDWFALVPSELPTHPDAL